MTDSIEKLLISIDEIDEINKINEVIDAINSGSSITVDTELSTTSENPVQNKVITAALNNKQKILIAGTNISISNEGIISATDTTYTAGDGISIDSNNVISSDNYSYSATCPALTTSGGKCTWQVTHNLGTQNVVVSLYVGSTELEKDVTIISDNVIEVSFFSSSDITAGTRKIVVVANGASSGNTPAVDSNFLSKGTIISIETDGSGDFTNLPTAISYLTNKWSNGKVEIHLGEGTFTINELLTINGENFNIPQLYITGEGTDKTVLSFTTTENSMIDILSQRICISSIFFSRPELYNTVNRGIKVDALGELVVHNCKFNHCKYAALASIHGCKIIIKSVEIVDCEYGLWSELGNIVCELQASIKATNVGTLFNVNACGIIQTCSNLQLTNVTKTYGIEVNKITGAGLIMQTS